MLLIKILLALSWVLASCLATIASPLMIPVDGDNTGMTRTENRRSLDRRVNSKPAAKEEQPIKVPVQLWIAHQGEAGEHWALVIDSTNGFDVQLAGNPAINLLKPRKFNFDTNSSQKLRNLNCQATFKTKSEMDSVFSQLENLSMSVLATEKGGNCMDYVRMALTKLEHGKHILEIPPAFEKLWNDNYKEVQARVWGWEWMKA
ncbi:hypothetical protein BDP27DRAFT_1367582 [Rhodocollybia butyracea]|uniref:Ubiquitin-like protease family profile domain-containing protein n=1 Tax=Rhodocollybia butyracea TaxID=206335 RepID=A0A9P5U2W2_9AGAR|nr:hypothetical protein BDP27DRAFT_1367582 [Rhodocollybia butyracea]